MRKPYGPDTLSIVSYWTPSRLTILLALALYLKTDVGQTFRLCLVFLFAFHFRSSTGTVLNLQKTPTSILTLHTIKKIANPSIAIGGRITASIELLASFMCASLDVQASLFLARY